MKESGSYPIERQNEADVLAFDERRMTLLLNVVPEDAALDLLRPVAEKEGLAQKTEFHLTLIGMRTGGDILKKTRSLSSEEKEKTAALIDSLAKSFAWSHAAKPEYYVITRTYEDNESEERKSIVQRVELPDLATFYEKLNDALGTDFKVPFPHITLFTTSTNAENALRGIGVDSREQFEAMHPQKIDIGGDSE